MIEWLALILAAVGHGCLVVVAVNVFHGLGISEPRMRWAKPLFLIVVGAACAGLLAVAWSSPWSEWPAAVQGYAWLCVAVAAVALPVVTIQRSLRRLPTGVAVESTVLDLANGRDRNAFIGRGLDSWWLRVPRNQAFEIEMSQWQVEVPRLPDSWDGLSILHLSDLHLTPAYGFAFFEALFDRLAAVECDLAVFTGDLIDDEEHLEWVGPLLSRVRGRLGQFGILGNHDYRHDPGRALAAMAEAGFEPLEGESRRIVDAAGTLSITGTSAPWGPWPPGIAGEADLRLLLCHTPDGLYRAAREGYDLVLSGHTHGGQYRLPVIGPILMPSRYSRRFDGGCFQTRETLMMVSRGIAGQHPLRVNCRPEVGRLVLQSPARTGPRIGLHAGRRVSSERVADEA